MSADPRRLAALIETQTVLAATGLDKRSLLSTVAAHVRELTGADASLVELVVDGHVQRAVGENAVVEVGVPLDPDALAGQAFFQDQLLSWEGETGNSHAMPASSLRSSTAAAIAAPLTVENAPLGVVTVLSSRPGAFDEGDRDTVRRICRFAAHQLQQIDRLEQAERTSRRDPLTSLGNRRLLDETLSAELARHARYGRLLSLCLIDLDDFKSINDTYGHPAGDRVLTRVAEHLSAIRGADSAFRLGGDEFAIVLPETGENEAELVARRLARRIRDEPFPDQVNVSWGIAQATGTDVNELVSAADQKLYERKRSEPRHEAAS